MTEISHILAPAGWKMDKNPGNAGAKFLPEEGAALLIGRTASSQTCTVVWFDKTGKLLIVEKLVRKGPYWEGSFKEGKQTYVVTAWKAGSQNGNLRIEGDIEVGVNRRVAAAAAKKKPDTAFEIEGTWGAEANNPGGRT